ncbi:MAG: Rieske (2Fe-2S) protein [Solirubrobacteraceae bacterium]|nr:Rieske (2Fe-2S) protein [Solirubrobacteraceae bacterium]
MKPAEQEATAAKEEYMVGPVDDVPERDGLLVDVAGETEVGIFKVDGTLYAYENRCVHQGGPVCAGVLLGKTEQHLDAGGRVLSEDLDDSRLRLVCPWHGWEYDITTGRVAHDARYRLRPVELTVRDGYLYVVV